MNRSGKWQQMVGLGLLGLVMLVLLAACDEEGRAPRQAQLSIVAPTFAPLVENMPTPTPGPARTVANGQDPATTADFYNGDGTLPNIPFLNTPPSVVTFAGYNSNQSGVRYDVRYGQISLPRIDQIISQYRLPATSAQGQPLPNPVTGKGQYFIQMGQKYGINPAYALAWAIKESSLGTTGIAPTTNNMYGIIFSAQNNCPSSKVKVGADGRSRTFCAYNSLEEGIEAWFRKIRIDYMGGGLGRGYLLTVDQIVPVYAPASDNNDVALYISQIKNRVDTWGAAGNG